MPSGNGTDLEDAVWAGAGSGIFLQTKVAQGMAGAAVWVALFLTCQQVSRIILFLLAFITFTRYESLSFHKSYNVDLINSGLFNRAEICHSGRSSMKNTIIYLEIKKKINIEVDKM
jgi:hypothetical protein